jgi:Protein of unknown function (DUF3326)
MVGTAHPTILTLINQRPYTVALIVPTGIGASMGGYAGDAIPIAKALAASCDRLITHPNVMNGAQMYWPLPNTFYVEGYALDRFAAGTWGLQPTQKNKIGIVFDRAIEPDLLQRHIQAADAARAALGLDITGYILTDEPLGVELKTADSGASWGTVERLDSLLRAADKLINQGATAIAVVARFPDDPGAEVLQAYRRGQGVDPLAGAEAVISHALVREFKVPCAHAPALSTLDLDPEISPRSAAEELGYTFLPCVLVGLSKAPTFTTNYQANSGAIWGASVDAVIVPASACGGSALLSFAASKTKIITVAENHTRMSVYPADLGIAAISVSSYLEAIGVVTVDRAGMSLDSFTPQITPLRQFS